MSGVVVQLLLWLSICVCLVADESNYATLKPLNYSRITEIASDVIRITEFEHEIYHIYGSNETDSAANSLIGLLLFKQSRIEEALVHLSRAYRSIPWSDERKPTYLSYYYSCLFGICKQNSDYSLCFEVIMDDIVTSIDQISLWSRFVLLLMETNNPTTLHQAHHRVIDPLLEMGLSCYPNMPGLLYYQGVRYYQRNNLVCAAYFMNLSLIYFESTSKRFPMANEFDSMQQNYEFVASQANFTENLHTSTNTCTPARAFTTPFKSQNMYLMWNFQTHQSTSNSSIATAEVNLLVIKSPLVDNATAVQECLTDASKCGVYSVQIGCNLLACVRRGWVVVDAVQSLSTHIVTSNVGHLNML